MNVFEWARLYAPLMQANVPDDVTAHLARLSVDTIAIAHHARRERVGATAFDGAGLAAGKVPVWGGGTASALDAAFLNGTAAEALDFQEVLIDGRNNGHAAVVILPALVAIAAEQGPSGDRLAHALWVAFAANIALARTLGRGHRAGEVGFRTTSMTAPIAAALGAGFLLGDARIAGHAAAICAASLPAGLLAAMSPAAGDFSVDKDLSVGFSARHAAQCAMLAAQGATGPSNALTGPRSWIESYGFGTAQSKHLKSDPMKANIDAYALKLYPANFGCQCAIRLAIEMGQDPAQVDRLDIRVKSSSAASLGTRDLTTHVAARFSLVYAAASAFVRQRSVLSDFDADAINDPQIRDFMDKVHITGDDALQTRHERDGIFPASLTVTLTNGETRTASCDTPTEGLDPAAVTAIMHAKLHDLCDAPRAQAMIAFCGPDLTENDFAGLCQFD